MPGSWDTLHQAPPVGINTTLLLTDGKVIGLRDDGSEASGKDWWRLTADSAGNYISGSWSPIAPMKNARRYFASVVLADGRMLVAGGEYSDAGGDLNAAEIYDPLKNTWTSVATPTGWTALGDAPCSVLSDGRVIVGSIAGPATAIYDPRANTWTQAANKDDRAAEETWTLLRDGSVLTVECSNHPKAEKYVPTLDRWVAAGTLPVDLVQSSSLEIGPAVLLFDGRVFAVGATGHTATYTPASSASDPGRWLAGPDFPKDSSGTQLAAKDAPACLLPNGHVLCVVSPVAEGTDAHGYPGPSYFYEFDGAALIKVPDPSNSAAPSYAGRLLLLPTGQALFSNGTTSLEVYTPDGAPQPSWLPEITSVPRSIAAGRSYALQGRRLNGLSQAVSYGDDSSAATNYPLVRLRSPSTGTLSYCRTFGHSTMSVGSPLSVSSTNFMVPASLDNGPMILEVVANGIASQPQPVTIGPAPPDGRPTARGCAMGALIPIGIAVALIRALIFRTRPRITRYATNQIPRTR